MELGGEGGGLVPLEPVRVGEVGADSGDGGLDF